MLLNHASRAVVEPLEDRRYASTTALRTIVRDAGSGSVEVRAFVGDRTLYVNGTDGADSVRVQTMPNGQTQISFVSLQHLDTAGRPVDTGNAGPTLVVTTSYTMDKGTRTAEITPNTVRVSGRYTIASSAFDKVLINGGTGHDVLRLAGLPFNPVAVGVERIILRQHTAPAGQTPSDTTHGGHFGPNSSWASEAARQQRAANRSDADIAVFGDSHAERYATVGRRSWQKLFNGALNLGISGDSTRQLMTRIEDGLFDAFKPRTVVVMIGTNNFKNPMTSGTDRQIHRGVLAVVAALRERLPNARIALVGMLPQPEAGVDPRARTLNARLRATAPGHGFAFLDPYAAFADGRRQGLMTNDAHMTAKGYEVMNELLARVLVAL
ncbi:MAG TPA: GDSL-type esterase/lipase family protein [Tepidisphaeraceae bacterium]|jgi:lysophospholipase L1-like esterase